MEEKEKGTARIMDWEQLKEMERNPQEELLLTSVYKLEPPYWSGVKAVEDYLYGAFCFHEGINAAFLLNEQTFFLTILKDKKEILQKMQTFTGEM